MYTHLYCNGGSRAVTDTLENETEPETRKSPEEIVYAIMEALGQNQQFTDEVAHTINSNWETAWKYLKLIQWIQECPKVITDRIGNKRTWKREWGRLPE